MLSQSTQEWLEADGFGGFASGTSTGIRTRRYHALLLTATTPPTGRLLLVNGFDAWIETPKGRFALTSQRYAPDVIHPDGAQRIEEFSVEPWPKWLFKFEDGTELAQEIFVAGEAGVTALTWRLTREAKNVRLYVRPLLSGRDYHGLHKENAAFRFDPTPNGEKVLWRPYEGLPGIYAMYSHNGHYAHDPLWYRNFLYEEERARGLDDTEDLASPGVFEWDLSGGEAVWLLTTTDSPALSLKLDFSVKKFLDCLRGNERMRRAEFPSRLHRAADAYIVNGRHGKTIMAGYPWFTDWGRDTFIAVRGLCLATSRLADARDILVEWAGAVSEGMLPNRFPDRGEAPEFNSVDASLWYVVAVHELLQLVPNDSTLLTTAQRRALESAAQQIVNGYAAGTRFGIRMDADGLLSAGVPGVQLTWMDARVGDRVITPRVGKPVEIQALWLNALSAASRLEPGWRGVFERGRAAFVERFWNEALGRLADVIDVDHIPGTRDDSFRPNQILAVGGLPVALVDGQRGRRIVDAVERHLLTPVGLRSLAPSEPGYAPRYEGDSAARDAVYHQGTVWPWLIGPFVDAWVRVRGNTAAARRDARAQFVDPLLTRIQTFGLGHLSEIADAEAPFEPKGCPFQAWSLGELLRLDRVVLVESKRASELEKRPSRRLEARM